ncbi:MAG: elongation factor P 5-aminopentanone reductase [Eubacteriales bacterium]|jgi:3-oxoacyl-[acyl-carrier protein] reductase
MRVLVTGATRGIGRETALAFLEQGYEVIGVYVKSDDQAKELKKKGITLYKCDISNKKQVENLAKKVGDIDILVNNAGISLRKVFQTVNAEEEQRLYGVNLFGTLNVTRAFLQGMINQKSGAVINVSSVFGEIGGSCEVDYSASKAALIGLTKALAKEVGPSCVRVNCVTPGIIDTDVNSNLSIDDVRDLTDEIPLECLGKAREVADVITFLASEKASYITGSVIRVDGGWK